MMNRFVVEERIFFYNEYLLEYTCIYLIIMHETRNDRIKIAILMHAYAIYLMQYIFFAQ